MMVTKATNAELEEKLRAKTSKYIWLGRKYGLAFDDPE